MKTNIKKHFTILELMVVLLIMGMAAGIAVVKLDNFLPALRMDSSARQIAGLISHLYDASVSSGKLYGLKYNGSENYYEVRLIWSEKYVDGKELFDEDQSLSTKTYLPDGVRFKEIKDDFGQSVPQDDDKIEVRFDPSGFVTPHRIHLEDDAGNEITLEVLFLTGEVIFHEGYYEPRVTLDSVVPK